MKKILIIGMGGQLGFELNKFRPEGFDLIKLTEAELDITDKVKTIQIITEVSPDVVINCAAYTNVDKAEADKQIAFDVNKTGPENIAIGAKQAGSRLIHISTDFVFDGSSLTPYQPDDLTNPINAYGESKLQGELSVLKNLPNSLIIRTAWLYSSFGNNFVKTMLKLMKQRNQLGIVADQIGTPTWAGSLAKTIWKFLDTDARGVFHYTDAGVASWYDFTVAIYEEASRLGILENSVEILPIKSIEYPTPAKRPHFSLLDKTKTYNCLGIKPTHWRVHLRECLEEIRSVG